MRAAAIPAVLMLSLSPLLTLAATGERWEYTNRMRMEGMGEFPMTMEHCQEPGWKNPPAASKNENDCKTTDMKRSGNTITWKMSCEGEHKMTGEGKMTYTDNSFTGSMDATTEQGKMHMDMSGRKLGTCDTEAAHTVVNGMQMPTQTETQNLMKQAEAQMAMANAQSCGTAVNDMQVYVMSMPNSPCASQKPAFCKKLTRPETIRMLMERDPSGDQLDQSAEFCGMDGASIKTKACETATSKKDWDFVGSSCPEQRDALAKEQCAGRDYTAVAQTEYGSFCTRYASDQLTHEEPKKDMKDKAKEGLEKLKSLIKW